MENLQSTIHLKGTAQSYLRIIEAVRSRLVNTALFVFTLIAVPAAAASVYRSKDIGWHDLMYFHLGALFIFGLTCIFQRKLTYIVRAFVLLGVLFILGVGALLTWGIMAMTLC